MLRPYEGTRFKALPFLSARVRAVIAWSRIRPGLRGDDLCGTLIAQPDLRSGMSCAISGLWGSSRTSAFEFDTFLGYFFRERSNRRTRSAI